MRGSWFQKVSFMMLMFDNLIFASFIPQFLMVVAFVTCLISPKATDDDRVENVPVQLVVRETQLEPRSTYVIVDEFNSDIKNSETIAYCSIDETHWYPKSLRFSSSNEPEFRFSRPPPAFLLINT